MARTAAAKAALPLWIRPHFQIADAEARKSGKTYLVASSPHPSPAVYVSACDHPDARNPGINIVVEQTPAGERIRRARPSLH